MSAYYPCLSRHVPYSAPLTPADAVVRALFFRPFDHPSRRSESLGLLLLTKATQGLNGKATKRSDYFQEIFNKHLPKNTGNVSDSKRFQSVKDFRHDVGKWWQEFEPYMQEQLDFVYPD